MLKTIRNFILVPLILLSFSGGILAQPYNYAFTSGPIPMCDTSYFTANVSGIGTLYPPGTSQWYFTLQSLGINITSNHPQTLQILLTSPQGTTLLLSEFNGTGGFNYTNCNFLYNGAASITTGSAPFTGNWLAQGGSFSVFDYENGDGVWVITIIDTACGGGGGGGGGGPWTSGWFNGGGGGPGGNGGFTIDFSLPPPPPCWGGIPFGFANICAGQTVDILSYYNSLGTNYMFNFPTLANPSAVTMAGSYLVEAYDPWDGCLYWATFDVVVLPQASIGPDQTVNTCLGASVDLSALFTLSGLTPYWTLNGVPISAAIASAATAPGVYEVIGQNPAGCDDTAMVTLNIGAGPALGVDQSLSSCSGISVDLTALFNTSGLTSTWYLSGNPFSSPAAANAAGVYMLIASDAGGCSDTAEVTLIIYPSVQLGADQNITGCVTGAYNLTPLYNTAGLTATWYFNGNPVANPSGVVVNGTYTLIASAVSGCADTALVTLSVTQKPNLGADQSISTCPGILQNLTSLYSTGANTVAWYFGGAPFASPSSAITAGVYTLIIINAAGCSDTAQVTLAVQPAPVLGADQSESICSNTTLDLTVLYTTTGFTATWTLSGNPVANPAGVNIAGQYQLVATTSAGCADTAAVTLTVQQAPALGADQVSAICAGNTVDLTALYSTTGLTASWTASGLPVANPSAVGISGIYTLTVTNAAGCSDTALVNVNVSANPVLGADQSVTECDGIAVNLNTLFITSGNTVNWTTGGNIVTNASSVTVDGVYTITVTNPAGCTASANATLLFNPSPSLGADQATAICNGMDTDLTLLYNSTGLTSSWTLGGTVVADPSAVSAAGNYQHIVTNSFGCADTAQVTVTVNTGPLLGNDQSFALCPWQTIDLSAVFPVSGLTATYELNGNVVANSTAVYDSGMYVVTVTDTNGCTDEAIASVSNVVCLCIADFDYSGRCIQDPIQFELLADSVLISAHWNFGGASVDQFESDPQVKFNTDENVIVTLEALLSCGLVTVKKEMKMTDCADSCQFYLPTAFTPNGDGRNDTYKWYGECGPEEFSMEIYNRFGQLVFSSGNPYAAWDGKYENTESPSGIYVYHIAYRLPYQKKQSRTGSMSVMR